MSRSTIAPSRPPTCSSAARTCSTRARGSTRRTTCSSATARSPRSASPARSTRRRAPRSSTARAATCSPASSTRTCTCARPGQEHKEDLDSGTRAAAAGGYVAVVAMPNTDPVVDSAPVLRSLREAARREARIPVGFMASITRGLDGEALTEMAELAHAGALGFTDDGKPVAPRRHPAQGAAVPAAGGGVLCLHEEDPTLSGARRHARGRGVRAARAGRHPEHLRVDADRPRRRAGRLRGRPDPHPAPERARVGRGDRRGQGARRADHRRGVAAPPHAHRTRRCSSGSTRG